jgi:CRISPR/Cas system CSM-associated protein Csm3 (group 7 of RAMP superfamily)
MHRVQYKIEFLSPWHCGSGLSAGPVADLIVLKNQDQLPYLPGKTIKGLLRDALAEMAAVSANYEQAIIDQIFGKEALPGSHAKLGSQQGIAFFGNAELAPEEVNEIMQANLASFLYSTMASTQINEHGVAKNHSLRTIEVCVPVQLYGSIDNVSDEQRHYIVDSLKWIRSIGVNRNRGLGRCSISIL